MIYTIFAEEVEESLPSDLPVIIKGLVGKCHNWTSGETHLIDSLMLKRYWALSTMRNR